MLCMDHETGGIEQVENPESKIAFTPSLGLEKSECDA